jgi:acyl-CoA synthetase (AMP-forming)/AMP-acid ligase II
MTKGWLTTEGHTLGGLLDERLAADPDSLFLDCCGTPYTAATLNEAAAKVAGALAELGVRHGSTVAVILENGPAAVLSWVAVQRLGAIFVPVNTALKGELLRHQLSDASASVVIVQQDLLSRPAEILDSIDSVEHLVVVGQVPDGPMVPAGLSVKASLHAWDDLRTASPWAGTLVRPSDLAGIVYTGGTTGPSKGCALSHSYHVSIARHIIASWKRPEATLDVFRNLWLHTGDIGRVDSDGYLYFVGRKAEYLRRRGENISSWEMEKVFHEHQDIADVCVHAVASEVAEDDVKVTAVLRHGATLTEEQLCRWAIDRLPYFAVPRYVEFRAQLPLSETGRATKNLLKEEGVTSATWDREAAGLKFERR